MAKLEEGHFLDDGVLPPRAVVLASGGGLQATVAQGVPALALWGGLPCIDRMRGEKVKTMTGRGVGRPLHFSRSPIEFEFSPLSSRRLAVCHDLDFKVAATRR